MNTSSTLMRYDPAWMGWIHVPPVYIVGCARSGTTLMRLMLTAHPKVSISSEGAFIHRLRTNLPSYGDLSDPKNLKALYQDIQPSLEEERFLSPPAFEPLLEWVEQFGADVRSIIAFYGTWEARVLGKKELLWWGDNAPYHVYHIPFFDSLFPTSKFILMIRDPRDTCASSKSSFPWHDFDSAIRQWELSILHGVLGRLNLGPSRAKEVKYESLVTNPGAQLREICEFLGLEYTEEMLNYYESDAAKALSQINHHKNLLRPVFASSIGKYRQILTPEEIAMIEERLCTPMRHFGYLLYGEYDRMILEGLKKQK